MESISIIIPAYNEKELLESTVVEALETMSKLAIPCEFIIVDDGSTDGTAQIAEVLAAQNNNITVIHHSSNRGIGAALTSGFLKAKCDLIFSFLSADGQTNPNDIALYHTEIQWMDFVISYRLNPRPLHRRLLTGGLQIFIFLLFGQTPKCGVDCMFRRDILKKINIKSNTHLAQSELIIKAYRASYRFKKIGINVRPRTMGKSKVTKISKIFSIVVELIKLRLSNDYRSLSRPPQ